MPSSFSPAILLLMLLLLYRKPKNSEYSLSISQSPSKFKIYRLPQNKAAPLLYVDIRRRRGSK
jgi:hypothetical protein